MRYLIGLLLFIFLVIFVIIRLLSGGGGEEKKLPTSLASYADTSTVVRWIQNNPTQASETHRQVTIEVGQDVAALTVTKGYEGEILKTQSFPMNTSAYADFLLSLQRSGGFNLGNSDKDLADGRGYCATGMSYSYDIIDGSGDEIQHFWSASCTKGTFKGKPDIVRDLFQMQIPNYDELVGDLEVY